MHKFNFVDFLAICVSTLIHALNDGNATGQVLWLVAGGCVYLLIVLLLTDKHKRVKPILIRAAAYAVFCVIGTVAVRWLLSKLWELVVLLFRRDSIIHW